MTDPNLEKYKVPDKPGKTQFFTPDYFGNRVLVGDRYYERYEILMENLPAWGAIPASVKTEVDMPAEFFSPWQKDLIQRLISLRVGKVTERAEFGTQPQLIRQKEGDQNVDLVLGMINRGLDPTSRLNIAKSIEWNAQEEELGINIVQDESGKRSIQLKALDLKRLRWLRYKRDGNGDRDWAVGWNSRGKLWPNDFLKHVAYLDAVGIDRAFEQLASRGVFGNTDSEGLTYLQWGDKNVTTFGGLANIGVTDARCVVMLIDPVVLNKKRSVFLDPESLIPEFSSMGQDGRILERPGDSVMVFGGIPLESIIGFSFQQEDRRDRVERDVFIVDKKPLLFELWKT